MNSGKVDFVATKTEREQLRDEKADMAENASVQTRKDMGEETGADLMMIGTINSIPDQDGGKAVVFIRPTWNWWKSRATARSGSERRRLRSTLKELKSDSENINALLQGCLQYENRTFLCCFAVTAISVLVSCAGRSAMRLEKLADVTLTEITNPR